MQFGSKLVIDCKHMAVLDLLGLGLLGEDSLGGLPTGQRLQCSHQFPLRDVRLLLDLLGQDHMDARGYADAKAKSGPATHTHTLTSNVNFSLLLKSMRMVIWKVETCRMCFLVLEPVTCAPPTPNSDPSSFKKNKLNQISGKYLPPVMDHIHQLKRFLAFVCSH